MLQVSSCHAPLIPSLPTPSSAESNELNDLPKKGQEVDRRLPPPPHPTVQPRKGCPSARHNFLTLMLFSKETNLLEAPNFNCSELWRLLPGKEDNYIDSYVILMTYFSFFKHYICTQI